MLVFDWMGNTFSLKENLVHFFMCNNPILDGCVGHKDKYHDEDMRRIGQVVYNFYSAGVSLTVKDNADGHLSSSSEVASLIEETWADYLGG
jgi:hypothetical protein